MEPLVIMGEKDMYRNHEGYPDPTAGEAIAIATKEEKERLADVTNIVGAIKQIVGLAGFEIVGRIALKDRKTGKEYK